MTKYQWLAFHFAEIEAIGDGISISDGISVRQKYIDAIDEVAQFKGDEFDEMLGAINSLTCGYGRIFKLAGKGDVCHPQDFSNFENLVPDGLLFSSGFQNYPTLSLGINILLKKVFNLDMNNVHIDTQMKKNGEYYTIRLQYFEDCIASTKYCRGKKVVTKTVRLKPFDFQ